MTGHADPGGPWIPVGVGIHSGMAYVGSVGSPNGMADVTMLGDAVNTAARLASQAGAGEVVVSAEAMEASGRDTSGHERRELILKGRETPVTAYVMAAHV